MKIIVSQIPDEGIEIHSVETAKGMGIEPSDLKLNDDVRTDARVSRQGRVFFVDGLLRTSLCLTCSRCAGEFNYPVRAEFYCQEEPVREIDTEKEAVLHRGDMDIDHYAGDEVELNDIFREQVMLAIPMHPLCKADCRGLCPKCGQNLNIKKCDCTEDKAQNPFSIIKNLFE